MADRTEPSTADPCPICGEPMTDTLIADCHLGADALSQIVATGPIHIHGLRIERFTSGDSE